MIDAIADQSYNVLGEGANAGKGLQVFALETTPVERSGAARIVTASRMAQRENRSVIRKAAPGVWRIASDRTCIS